jgi:murein DD-endopeptidase MepM/ murein hydrolase activator NlpD
MKHPFRPILWLFVLSAIAGCTGSGNPLVPQLRPVEGGYISSGFGDREQHPVLGYVPGRHHDGYDIAVAAGTAVRASISGDVVSAGWLGGYGNAVVIQHANGYTTVYGHASELLVGAGQHVERGSVIARVGSTGLSTGPHLHYELRHDGVAIDPRSFDDGSYASAAASDVVRAPLGRASSANAIPQQPLTIARSAPVVTSTAQTMGWATSQDPQLVPDRPVSEGGVVVHE